MTTTLPTTFDNVASWLQALNMSKYLPAFESGGVKSADALRMLTDADLNQMGVSLAGHRKRLILGINALRSGASPATHYVAHWPPAPMRAPRLAAVEAASSRVLLSGSEAASAMDIDEPTARSKEPNDEKKKPSQPRYNSTSSIFINSTIMKPDIDEIIFCVSVVMHDRIEQVRSLAGLPPGRMAGTDKALAFGASYCQKAPCTPFVASVHTTCVPPATPRISNAVGRGGRIARASSCRASSCLRTAATCSRSSRRRTTPFTRSRASARFPTGTRRRRGR